MHKIHVLCISIFIGLFLAFGPVTASMLPVFRYALENWHPDTYELLIVYSNSLTDEETAVVEWLRKNSLEQLPFSNYTVRPFDLMSNDASDISELARTLDLDTAPFFVLRTSADSAGHKIICQGPLTFETAKTLIDSPARKEITERILSGDSAVWVLVESGKIMSDMDAGRTLDYGLTQINRLYSPQESLTAGGYNVSSNMPISFSSIKISRDDPFEFYFINMLLESSSASIDTENPFVACVFGRGRMLEIYQGDALDMAAISNACAYLVGACSDETKQDNPGNDLLMLADWDSGITSSWFVIRESGTTPSSHPSSIISRITGSYIYLPILGILAISLIMNTLHILRKPRKTCVNCQTTGIFTSINDRGLCRTCAPLIQTRMDDIGKTIQHNISMLSKSSRNAESQKICDTIINIAEKAIQFEKLGISLPAGNPEDLIKTYTAKRDALRMESKTEKLHEALTIAHETLQPYSDIKHLEDAILHIASAEELLGKMRNSTRIVAFINQKGGVGKTTSTLNIGAGLAKLGKKVLLVDFDPQANLTDGLGIVEEELIFSIYDLIKEKVDYTQVIVQKYGFSIIPSNTMLTRLEQEYGNTPNHNTHLRDVLKGIAGYDYILIDCPPVLGFLTLNALSAAKDIYIPFIPEYYALKGIRKTLDIVEYMKKKNNEDLLIRGLIGTRYEVTKKHHQEVVEKIQQSFGDKLYAIIREDISLSEASSYGQHIFDYKPESHGAKDYMSLCRKILQKT